MENQLSFVLKLTLEEMALRRVIINLWNEGNVLDPVQELRFLYLSVYEDEAERREWADNEITPRKKLEETVEKVKAKVTELMRPELLRNRMIEIVKPIGIEMLRRIIVFGDKNIKDSMEDSNMQMHQLCWTSTGMVDLRKTAEKLVRLQTIEVVKRYKLACLYCLEDDIPLIWADLPEEYKKRFDDIDPYIFISTILSQLEFYWAYVLMGEISQLNYVIVNKIFGFSSIYDCIFQHSARSGIKAAAEYFYQKLNDENRDSALCKTALDVVDFDISRKTSLYFSNEKRTDVLCFLLSLMSPYHQMQVLQAHSGKVLTWFLEWPCQDLFVVIADHVWTFLSESSYPSMINDIGKKFRNMDYYFPKLIQEFVLVSPVEFRKHFVSRLVRFLLYKFSYAEDSETMKILIRNVEIGNRKEFVCSYWFYSFLCDFMRGDKWNLVEVCLRELALSIEEIKVMKEAFVRFHDLVGDDETFQRHNNLGHLFWLLNEL